MGGLKEDYLEGQEERYFKIADALGITWGELLELDYSFDANVSKDGLIYSYLIRLADGNDPAVVSKIKKIRPDNTILLEPWVLERSTIQDEFDAIFENKDYKQTFSHEMDGLKKLLALPVSDDAVRKVLLRQIFITIIGAVETYLCDAFVNEVLSCRHKLRRFVETHPDFKKMKFSLSEVFAEYEFVEGKAKEVMLGTVYHQLPKIKAMYEDALQINFPDISVMQRFVTQRHDLVHRNGKTATGEKVLLNHQVIVDLQEAAVCLVDSVSSQLELEDIPF